MRQKEKMWSLSELTTVSSLEAAGLLPVDFSKLLPPDVMGLRALVVLREPKMLPGAGKSSGSLLFCAKMSRAQMASLSEMCSI